MYGILREAIRREGLPWVEEGGHGWDGSFAPRWGCLWGLDPTPTPLGLLPPPTTAGTEAESVFPWEGSGQPGGALESARRGAQPEAPPYLPGGVFPSSNRVRSQALGHALVAGSSVTTRVCTTPGTVPGPQRARNAGGDGDDG